MVLKLLLYRKGMLRISVTGESYDRFLNLCANHGIALWNLEYHGNAYEMDAIAATVVGGTPISGGKANVIGTIFGALILQLITIMINMNNIQYEYTYIIKSCIIIIAVLAHNLKRAKR